jgi:Domain of Unknown Function with PDB structure (DUF3857)/Transglutaminase-like superfamily
MVRIGLRGLGLLTLCVLLCPALRAFDFPALTDEDMKFREVPGQPGAPAAILYREEIDDDTKVHSHTTYERIKILTEAGRHQAEVEVPFGSTWSHIESISGRTVHADGSIVPFDGKVLDKEVVKAHGVKVHVKSFDLPDVQVGSIVEYRYTFRYSDLYLITPYWQIQGELWIKKAHYRFYPRQPDSYEGGVVPHVSWVYNLPENAEKPRIVMMGFKGYVEFEIESLPPFVSEPYMPNDDEFKCYVRFFYRWGLLPADGYWAEQGKDWSAAVNKFLSKDHGLKEQLTSIVGSTDPPEEKLKKIYAFIGTLENQSFRPERSTKEVKTLGMKADLRGVSDVLQQKSGTRDDLTLLFVALARDAGIPAYVMKLVSREERFFNENLLSNEQFDAEIAIVELNGKDVFLDPGTKYCPYGLLDWRHTATRGLRQTRDGAALADTPDPKYSDGIDQRVGDLVLKNDGTVEGTLKIGYFGQEALMVRLRALNQDAVGRKKEIEDAVRERLPSGAELKLINNPNWDTSEGPVIAEFHVVASVASKAGKRTLLPSLIYELNQGAKFPASQRVNGIYLRYPWGEVDQIRVTVPQDLEVESLPKNEDVHTGFSVYKTKWSKDGQTIIVRRDFVMGAYSFSQARYPEIKSFFDGVKTGDEQAAVLKGSATVAGK